jgi:hypothetical protein
MGIAFENLFSKTIDAVILLWYDKKRNCTIIYDIRSRQCLQRVILAQIRIRFPTVGTGSLQAKLVSIIQLGGEIT